MCVKSSKIIFPSWLLVQKCLTNRVSQPKGLQVIFEIFETGGIILSFFTMSYKGFDFFLHVIVVLHDNYSNKVYGLYVCFLSQRVVANFHREHPKSSFVVFPINNLVLKDTFSTVQTIQKIYNNVHI